MNSISGLENYQNQLSRITGLSDGQNQTSKTDAKSFGSVLEKAIAGLNSNMNTLDQGTNGMISNRKRFGKSHDQHDGSSIIIGNRSSGAQQGD